MRTYVAGWVLVGAVIVMVVMGGAAVRVWWGLRRARVVVVVSADGGAMRSDVEGWRRVSGLVAGSLVALYVAAFAFLSWAPHFEWNV